jgi:phosphate transport system permease protein
MRYVFFLATSFGIVVLGVLLLTIFLDGRDWIGWDLFREMPSSRRAEGAGLQSALFGSIWVVGIAALVAFPIGLGAAIYLEEYASDNTWTKVLQVNIANLAGVPSIVYGLLGLGIFVQLFGMGRSVIAGALTLALLVLPVVIIASREAIRAVPLSLRQAAYGLGATKWQVTKAHEQDEPGCSAGYLDRHHPVNLPRDRRDRSASRRGRRRVRLVQSLRPRL